MLDFKIFHKPLQEAVVSLPVGEPSSTHPHVLQKAQVANLVDHSFVIECRRGFVFVWLDAAHIKWFLTRQCFYQLNHRVLEQSASTLWSFGRLKFTVEFE